MRGLDWDRASRFFKPLSRTNKIHPNFVFRFHVCALSEDKAAKFAGVDIEQIHSWDDGQDLPYAVRRLWLLESGRALPEYSGFPQWLFKCGKLSTPEGVLYSERELRVALFLLDQTTTK